MTEKKKKKKNNKTFKHFYKQNSSKRALAK